MKMKHFARIAGVVLLVIFLAVAGSCDFFTVLGTVEGTVYSFTTGDGVAGVEVAVAGDSLHSTTTDANGYFTFDVPVGTQTLTFTLDGYEFPDVTVEVTATETTTIADGDLFGQPVLAAGNFRIVLTWGQTPYDLDSHLLTPSGTEIYYSNKVGTGVNLDVDDMSSYGPETITISTVATGTYTYFVHNYSGTPAITASSAVVRVYNSTGLIRTYNVPATGTGYYWNVFTLSGSTITDVNTISNVDPGYSVAVPRAVK
jgi:hypothetical protein